MTTPRVSGIPDDKPTVDMALAFRVSRMEQAIDRLRHLREIFRQDPAAKPVEYLAELYKLASEMKLSGLVWLGSKPPAEPEPRDVQIERVVAGQITGDVEGLLLRLGWPAADVTDRAEVVHHLCGYVEKQLAKMERVT